MANPFIFIFIAETSEYSPEQIQLVYWFVNVPKKTSSFKFQYNQEQHQQTENDLNQLLNQLSDYWQRYQQKGESFLQVEESQGYCADCPFTIPCERYLNNDDFLFSEIEEVKI